MLDIDVLRFIWWALIGIIFMGFAITDGFDLGAAVLLPLVARTDMQRRVVLNTVGPFWEGNQVWLILGAGAIFAAWPSIYAVAFSGFYLLVLILLLTLGISRPVSFKYRSKLPGEAWRTTWDWVVFIGGLVPALIFGILMGNVLTGVPFAFDNTLQSTYSGSFFGLFKPFPIWCGLTSLAMLTLHGGIYLAIKTEDPICERAALCAQLAGVLLIILFAGGGFWIANVVPGYVVVSGADPVGYSNPLNKEVAMQAGAWLNNYSLYPYTLAAPALGLLGALFACFAVRMQTFKLAFLCSCLDIVGVIGTVGLSMFPFMLPSSSDPMSSLVVWDASSGQLTLLTMLIAVIIFLPLILMYTTWVYYALRGKVDDEQISTDKQAY